MSAGYSKKPLFQKLGIKDGMQISLIHPPENYMDLLMMQDIEVRFVNWPAQDLDFIHLFTKDRVTLEENFSLAKKAVKKAGMIWISWYKKAAKIPTDVTENVIREIILPTGMVDVKVCAVDQQWSGLKVVWRKDKR